MTGDRVTLLDMLMNWQLKQVQATKKKFLIKQKLELKDSKLMNLGEIENFNKPEQVVSSIKDIWHNAHINKVRKNM